MTKYWTTNSCSLNQNTIFSDWNAQGYRKALITELFFLFFIYFLSQIIQALLYTNQAQTQSSPEKKGQINQAIVVKKQAIIKQLPWHEKKWNRTFAQIFSHNCIAIGMCVLFSPFAGAITIAYFHLIFFIIYCFLELKILILPAQIVRILMDLCNLTLILIGTASINLQTCNSDKTCKGVSAGTLQSSTCFN